MVQSMCRWSLLCVFAALFHGRPVDGGVASEEIHHRTSSSQQQQERNIIIHNEVGVPISVDWVNPSTGESEALGTSTKAGESVSFNFFVNHTFLLRSNEDSGPSSTVSSDQHDQWVLVKENLKVERRSSTPKHSTESVGATTNTLATEPIQTRKAKTMAQAVADRCRQAALSQQNNTSATTTANLIECLTSGATDLFLNQNEELAFEKSLRRSIAHQTENYTCADPRMETSAPIRTTEWKYENATGTLKVGVLHEHKDSHIHILYNFISPSECRAIQEAAAPTLHRGTVADGKGGSMLSDNRKAWQSGVKVDDYNTDNPIANVKKRLFAYANHAVGFQMELDGQEDIMSIQYFGKPENATISSDETMDKLTPSTAPEVFPAVEAAAPDQYTPHCDGECTGMPHKSGGRVATMVMYCDVPAAGSGATNFQQANVHVKPTLGAAVFFAYMNPTTGIHDDGFTTHSGCPVTVGTKRIAVQWMRVGVDEDNPWDSFDTNTVRRGK